MNCITEALGISLRGNGTVPAVYSKRKTLARNSGRKIMSLVEKNILPRDIINEKSIKNALTLDMALGCSTNTVLHLTAIAREAHCPIDLKIIDEISSKTPNLCKLSPAGPYHIQELDEVGGIYAVLNELSKKNLINKDAMTVYEKPIGEMIKTVNKKSNKIIKDIDNPYSPTGGIKVLFGNLAKEGAVVKKSAVDEKMMNVTLNARVYDSEEDAKLLVKLVKNQLCHINLIPVNSTDHSNYKKPDNDRIQRFINILSKNGINATIRREMGTDINGACGQLRISAISKENL